MGVVLILSRRWGLGLVVVMVGLTFLLWSVWRSGRSVKRVARERLAQLGWTTPDGLPDEQRPTERDALRLMRWLHRIAPADRIEDLEVLFFSDLGVLPGLEIQRRWHRRGSSDAALREALTAMIRPVVQPFDAPRSSRRSVLVLGSAGAGRTSTAARLACTLKDAGSSVTLVDGDGLRLSLEMTWVDRVCEERHIPYVTQLEEDVRPRAAVHEGLQLAGREGIAWVVVDTPAITTVARHPDQLDPIRKLHEMLSRRKEAPVEVWLVLDARHRGVDMLRMVNAVQNVWPVAALAITKLDIGSGAGLVRVAHALSIPWVDASSSDSLETLTSLDVEAFARKLASGG